MAVIHGDFFTAVLPIGRIMDKNQYGVGARSNLKSNLEPKVT